MVDPKLIDEAAVAAVLLLKDDLPIDQLEKLAEDIRDVIQRFVDENRNR